jgi:hypothetical protein
MNEKETHPAKPGSKLDSIQRLGRRGGIRPSAETPPPAVKPTGTKARKLGREDAAHARPASAPTPQSETTTIRPRKAKTTIARKLKTAKAVLAKAEEDAMVKPGPTPVVGEPWKDLDPPISKSAYYRRMKAQAAKAKSKGKKKAEPKVVQSAKRATQNAGKNAP